MALPLPAKQRTWVIDPNNRIVFSSLVQSTRQLLWEIKEWLKAAGATIVGTSNGTTANIGGSDLWVAATDAGTRAANTTTAHSWALIGLGNGVTLLLDFVGTADNQARLAYSTGAYSLAGTVTFSPTTTDEVFFLGTSTLGADLIATTASGDRLWHGWLTADLKNFRVAIVRAATTISLFGVEEIEPTGVVDPGAVVFSPPTWGFFYGGTTGGGGPSAISNLTGPFSANIRGGRAKAVVGGITAVMDLHGGGEAGSNGSTFAFGNYSVTASKLQGDAYPLTPVSLFCTSPASHSGKLANRVDWWGGKTAEATGGHIGNVEFVNFGDGFVWPWDGTPSVPGTAITVT